MLRPKFMPSIENPSPARFGAIRPGARLALTLSFGLLSAAMPVWLPAFLHPAPAQAATVLSLDLAELVQQADVIVLGQAEDKRGRWAPRGKLIVTDVEFAVQRALKGKYALGDRIRITHLGGEVEGESVALTVPGEATFKLGQPVLVFLRRAAQDELRVVGMAQGLMVVEGTGASASVRPIAEGPALLTRLPDGSMKSSETAPATNRPLSDVIAEVERMVAGAGR